MSGPATRLIARWDARDARYAVRKTRGVPQPLSDGEQDAVRAFRRSEALALPVYARETALGALARWVPPRTAL